MKNEMALLALSLGCPFLLFSALTPWSGYVFSLLLDELSQYFGIARDKL